MSVFVDTSAVFAFLDDDDAEHQTADRMWGQLVDAAECLITTNYVVLETATLLQRRLGFWWVEQFETTALPLLSVVWVDEEVHNIAMRVVIATHERELTLVDCTSFEIMRRLGVSHAFAFDKHFEERDFRLPPDLLQS